MAHKTSQSDKEYMNTFTTYAEKKAKQFLNLLQGYTKGIRMTAILILLLMGVSSAWAEKIYFKPWISWKSDARLAAYFYGSGTESWSSFKQIGSSEYYVCDIPSGSYTHVIFCRMNPSATANNWDNKYNQSAGDKKIALKSNALYKQPTSNNPWDNWTCTGSELTWYIAGGFNEWSTTSNKLPCTIALDANNGYTFKLVASEVWLGNNGTMTREYHEGWEMAQSEDCTLSTDIAGNYQFSFDTKTAKLTVTYPEECYLKGDFNDWGNTSSLMSGSTTINLKAKTTYKFKIHNYGATSESWHGNTGTMTRDNCSGWKMDNATDCQITTDVAGDYTFTYERSTQKLSVTYPTAYTVTYSRVPTAAADAPTTSPSISSGDYVLANTSVTFNAQAAKTGYTWKGWYSNNTGTGNALSTNLAYTHSITANTTIYAVYTANTYTVKFDANGGTGTMSNQNFTYGTAQNLTANAFTRTHYAFAGWNTEENGSGTSYADKQQVNNLSTTNDDIIILYAQWTPKKYAITYKDQGDKEFSGTHANGYPTTHTYNTTTTLLEATKSGYTFAGWYRDSECAGVRVGTLGADVTEAITLYAKWEVASYTITFDKQEGTGGTTSVTAQYGAKLSAITIPSRDGYLFDGYYTQTSGNGTKYYNADGTTDKNMPYDVSTLYAKWVPYSQCIFFKNTLDWKNVYVYTFSNNVWYDNEDSNTQYGPGVCTKVNVLEFAKMTQINNTDIYYYILTKQNGFNHIAFSDADMNNWNEFYGNNAIYRADRNDQLPLFIPKKSQTPTTTNSTKYYSSGIWMKYNSTESGYDWRGATSESKDDPGWNNSFAFTASKPGGYTFKASVTFNNINQHFFKIHNIKNDWFGNGGIMTQNNCTNWTFGSNNGNNAKITPTITGTYNFTIYLGDGEVSVSLDYPLSVDDYRLAYKDDTEASHHPGHYLKKHSETQTDTVSFFIYHNQHPEIIVEKCKEITDGIPTWEKVADITNNPAASITESGVYNFFLQQIEGQTIPTLVNEAMPYTGNYYIRTDAAEGGWDSFRQQSNQITYSSFADAHSNFNHYYCKYIEAGRNVKFTIANDYSYCISDTLDNDKIIEEGQSSTGCLPINANVRFGWDSNTNEISRAYIKGAGMTSDRFLVLQGKDNNLKDANGAVIPEGTGDRTGLLANEEILVDQQNWIYQVDVTANKDTEVKLIAEYNGQTQYFKGKAEEYTPLLSSTASTDYKIRLIYDFKSNHLVTAWLAGGNIVEGEKVLGADMMVIRKDQGQAEQLNFDPTNSKMNEVGTGYAVMTFTQPHITDNTKTERERSLYWVSFPFDVKVSDVFGFGEYAEHWILQYYDGAERAEKGLFSDSGTYWKYIEDKNTTLWAGTGYVLALDLNKIEFLHGATEVSLYFPSINPLTMISGELTEAIVPEHWCNIDREWTENGTTYHHKWTDSHWNLIGVPGFADITGFDVEGYYWFTQYDASFYYAFDLKESKYIVASAATNFQAMYSYMVQFAGTIDWSIPAVVPPTELTTRRNSDAEPERVALRLELAQGEEVIDRTFVQLQQEGATANFDLSLDLTKIMNSGFSNIYTLTDSLKIQVAGNALPMEETVVSVGVNIAAAGEYTFRMPDGTEGMVVELIDYEANTTTNLLLDDYTVNLPTGSNETRFALSIKPEKTATNVGNIGGTMNDGLGVRKFIIDGKLYLQKDGMLYDAQGHIVR